MNPEFWHARWQNNEIGFHESQANPMLVKHFKALGLLPGSRVFLPLCGKTLDIAWLLAAGHPVAGAELSETAIQQLFTELGVEPRISEAGALRRYEAENIVIFVGDIFALSAAMLGPVAAVYDRAALVALPDTMRSRYTTHLAQVTQNAPQLLITFEYDQNLMQGPPFSIAENEVRQHYDGKFQLQTLETGAVRGGLRGKIAASERVWYLKPMVG